MVLYDLLLQITQKVLDVQENKGFMLPGHNGPYYDQETQVRNSSHWLVTFAKFYQWTGQRHFKDKVAQLAEYLISEESRPYGYSFYSRNTPHKDKCNGLIGQAWAFEALVEASKCLDDDKYVETIEDVFLKHEFCEERGLWHRLEIDGEKLPIDMTFNHQLWFAACSAMAVGLKEKLSKKTYSDS